MAQDQTLKARNLALDLMACVDQVMGGLERAEAILQEKEGTALDWTSQGLEDMLGAEPQLQHLTGWHLNSAHTNLAAIYNGLRDGGTLTAGMDDALQAIRPGNWRNR